MKEIKELSGDELCRLVVHGMLEKKAANIVVMDLRKVKNSITDFFVICSGNTDTQIDAIATSVDDEVFKATKMNPWHQEGKQNKEWILLDYIDVVVHVFRKDRRKFYDLESLWGDAELTQIEESMEPEPEKQMMFN
ncbi:ribosome silencing factor [Emticicia sp. SJ17W-69]|uniref:ribosome silencing factor n=1 Tax=Emticicia sp. SJ17W-69 TaxID=3421657 RepID=UPI003EBFE3AA